MFHLCASTCAIKASHSKLLFSKLPSAMATHLLAFYILYLISSFSTVLCLQNFLCMVIRYIACLPSIMITSSYPRNEYSQHLTISFIFKELVKRQPLPKISTYNTSCIGTPLWNTIAKTTIIIIFSPLKCLSCIHRYCINIVL